MDVIHLNQKQLAHRWSVSEATLERWRVEIKPFDSSTAKSLIFLTLTRRSCGLRAGSVRKTRREKWPEERELGAEAT